MKICIQIHPADNVAVALAPLSSGTAITPDICEGLTAPSLTLTEDIPAGHKFALSPVKSGDPVIKYGHPIGYSSCTVSTGSWVHTHNLKTGLEGQHSYTWQPEKFPRERSPRSEASQDPAVGQTAAALNRSGFFDGYLRPDGQAGIRNEIWILPTVGCVSRIAGKIAEKSRHLLGGSLEAITAFSHPYGCSQSGEDQEATRRILADLALHPNAGGVLLVGLGCENSGIPVLQSCLGDFDKRRIRFLVCQDCEDEVAEGLRLVEELARYAKTFHRTPVSIQKLVVGLKCGGSDGLSGITANPAAGRFSDRLIAAGGTAILTEVPEMFGAETLLMNRCETKEIFRKTVDLINGFKQYFTGHGQPVYENPSPGNRQGGITTLEDKSLGCTQKSGSAPVRDVLDYGARVSRPGLNLLNAPGNDLVSSTALAAAGAQIVLFTTGRGTPFSAPVPTVKISSNTPLAMRKKNWIDFDCGTLTGKESRSQLDERFFSYVLQVASGRQTAAERAGYQDMAIFKRGVTL